MPADRIGMLAYVHTGAPSQFMRRLFLLVLALGAIALFVGMLALGAFPPEARPRMIEKVLPNDRFQRGAPPPAPPIPPATTPGG